MLFSCAPVYCHASMINVDTQIDSTLPPVSDKFVCISFVMGFVISSCIRVERFVFIYKKCSSTII